MTTVLSARQPQPSIDAALVARAPAWTRRKEVTHRAITSRALLSIAIPPLRIPRRLPLLPRHGDATNCNNPHRR